MGEAACFFVVEDDAALVRTFVRVIRRFGTVVTSCTRKDAFRVLERPTPFAAMLVDVCLPDGSGLDVLQAAREKPWLARMSALVMTAYLDQSVTHRAFVLDARFLAKPFEMDHLNAYLRSVVTNQGFAAARRHSTIQRWQSFYILTERQTDLLRETVEGASRQEIAKRWGVTVETLKKHAHELIARTGDNSLQDAVTRVLREAMDSSAEAFARDQQS